MSDNVDSSNSLPRKDVRIVLKTDVPLANGSYLASSQCVYARFDAVRNAYIDNPFDAKGEIFICRGDYAYEEIMENGDLVRTPAEADPFPPAPAAFVTKDSGKREEWSTGSRRDLATGKGRHDLLPAYPIKRLAQLYERGAAKYGDRNWEKGQPLSRYLQSGLRHFFDFLEGDRSEDHLIAVVWNIFAFLYTERQIRRGKLPKELDDTGETELPEMST